MRSFCFCNITLHKVWVKLAKLPPLLIYLECVGVFMRSFCFCNITLHRRCDREPRNRVFYGNSSLQPANLVKNPVSLSEC